MTDDPEITDPRDPHKRCDIVMEVDRWLALPASLREATVSHALLQAARDEIVALRTRCALHDDLEFVSKNELTEARDDALEEAAQACVGSGAIVAEARLCASAIRALKEKRHD